MEPDSSASESFDVNLIDKNAINYNFGNHYGTVIRISKGPYSTSNYSRKFLAYTSRGIAALSKKEAIASPSPP